MMSCSLVKQEAVKSAELQLLQVVNYRKGENNLCPFLPQTKSVNSCCNALSQNLACDIYFSSNQEVVKFKTTSKFLFSPELFPEKDLQKIATLV